MQTALKIVQLRRRELESRSLIGFQYLPSTVPVDDAFNVLNDRIRCSLRLPVLPLLGWREGRSVRESARSRGSCSRQDVVIRWCIRRNIVRKLGVHRSNSYDSCAFWCKQFKQVRCWHVLENNAWLRRLLTRCSFRATLVSQFPTRRSPEFASSFSTVRAGPHGTHRKT